MQSKSEEVACSWIFKKKVAMFSLQCYLFSW